MNADLLCYCMRCLFSSQDILHTLHASVGLTSELVASKEGGPKPKGFFNISSKLKRHQSFQENTVLSLPWIEVAEHEAPIFKCHQRPVMVEDTMASGVEGKQRPSIQTLASR